MVVAEAAVMRSSMEEREDVLHSEMGRRQALNYTQGRIYTQSGVMLRPVEVFADESAGAWVERLVGDLFDKAFPSLPLEHVKLPGTLTPERTEAVFRGTFNGALEAAETAGAFGPAPGLSSPDSPKVFDGDNCRVLGIIERELASQGGAMSAEDILGLLCREHGLNRALATLYLIAFVRHSRAGLDLRPEHSLGLRQGGPVLSDRITWDLVTDLGFSVAMADQFGVLRAQPSPPTPGLLGQASEDDHTRPRPRCPSRRLYSNDAVASEISAPRAATSTTLRPDLVNRELRRG